MKLKADEAKVLLHDEAERLRLLKLHSVKLVAEAQAVKVKLGRYKLEAVLLVLLLDALVVLLKLFCCKGWCC